ncbi:hypothetical protein EDD99_8075 [Streptomyces sp. 846.5]|nr:hypothetical protein EDD99_8075 [Streptomyces sp. 846.5]
MLPLAVAHSTTQAGPPGSEALTCRRGRGGGAADPWQSMKWFHRSRIGDQLAHSAVDLLALPQGRSAGRLTRALSARSFWMSLVWTTAASMRRVTRVCRSVAAQGIGTERGGAGAAATIIDPNPPPPPRKQRPEPERRSSAAAPRRRTGPRPPRPPTGRLGPNIPQRHQMWSHAPYCPAQPWRRVIEGATVLALPFEDGEEALHGVLVGRLLPFARPRGEGLSDSNPGRCDGTEAKISPPLEATAPRGAPAELRRPGLGRAASSADVGRHQPSSGLRLCPGRGEAGGAGSGWLEHASWMLTCR